MKSSSNRFKHVDSIAQFPYARNSDLFHFQYLKYFFMIFALLSSCSFRLARRYLMNLTSVYFYFEIRSLYDFYLKNFHFRVHFTQNYHLFRLRVGCCTAPRWIYLEDDLSGMHCALSFSEVLNFEKGTSKQLRWQCYNTISSYVGYSFIDIWSTRRGKGWRELKKLKLLSVTDFRKPPKTGYQ